MRARPRWSRLGHGAAVCVLAAAVAGPAGATVEEQRARLPPPAACTDPIEGVWRSHKYNVQFGDWMIFTLLIRRTAPGAGTLVGTIEAHSWSGDATQSMPPPCTPGVRHWIVDMSARGVFVGERRRIEFWGTSWRVRERLCRGWPSYNLDHFTGTVESALQEFQSVNNDGGRSVNEPTVFRRVRCLEPAVVPHPFVAPPPYYPSTRATGCGR